MNVQKRSTFAHENTAGSSQHQTAGSPKLSIKSNSGDTNKHQSSRQSNGHDTTPRTKNTSKSIRLSDLMAAMYPGIKVGHKYCVQRPMLVPKTMGWLWNTENTATGVPFPRGWRPGAVALGIRRKVGLLGKGSISEPLSTPIGLKGKKYGKKKIKTASSHVIKTSSEISLSCPVKKLPPTLCIKKERGIYRVMMQPIKNAPDGAEDEQPVQFKIAENSEGSNSRASKSSSSSLQIEYMCTGALRGPVIKPELAEIGTQWDTSDFQKKKEVDKKEDGVQDSSTKEKKKGKKGKSASKDEAIKDDVTDEKKNQTQKKN